MWDECGISEESEFRIYFLAFWYRNLDMSKSCIGWLVGEVDGVAAVQLLSFHNFGFDISDIKSEMKLKGCGIIPHSITYIPHSSHKRM